MKLADFPSIQALSAVEKLQLVDEIWASLMDSESSLEEKSLLDERWASYERAPESTMSLKELHERIAELRK